MKDEILHHLNDARQLEKLYRSNKAPFKKAFGLLYPELKGNAVAECWHERLHYESDEINWGTRREFLFLVISWVIAVIIARLPEIFSISEEVFYPRNIAFIMLPALTAYFAWKHQISISRKVVLVLLTITAIIFINSLPNVPGSDTLVLSCIHLAIFMWALLGFSYTGGQGNMVEKRLGFLKYNGDLLVITGLILIAGGLLSGITIGLFSLIGLNIEAFYFRNVVISGLPAAPLLGTYLIRANPQLVGRISPVIARIFSPLVLVMLVVYLSAMAWSGRDPYNDREFLLLFNALLLGVMAIIFFTVAGTSDYKTRLETWILFFLSLVTIIVNGIALSAILFRISEWGFTANRMAVMGGNILILVNLVLVAIQVYRVLAKKAEIGVIGTIIAWYLPVYVVWAAMVTFLFPLIFGFR